MIEYNILEYTNQPEKLTNAWVVSVFRIKNIRERYEKTFNYVNEIKATIDILPYLLPDWRLVVIYDDSFDDPESNLKDLNILFYSIKEYGEKFDYVSFIKIEVPLYKNVYIKKKEKIYLYGHKQLYGASLRFFILDYRFKNYNYIVFRNSRNPCTIPDTTNIKKWVKSEKSFMYYVSQNYGSDNRKIRKYSDYEIYENTYRLLAGLFGVKKDNTEKNSRYFKKILKFMQYKYYKNPKSQFIYGVDEFLLTNATVESIKTNIINKDNIYFVELSENEKQKEIYGQDFRLYMMNIIESIDYDKYKKYFNGYSTINFIGFPYTLELEKITIFDAFYANYKIFDKILNINKSLYLIKNLNLEETRKLLQSDLDLMSCKSSKFEDYYKNLIKTNKTYLYNNIKDSHFIFYILDYFIHSIINDKIPIGFVNESFGISYLSLYIYFFRLIRDNTFKNNKHFNNIKEILLSYELNNIITSYNINSISYYLDKYKSC